MAKRLLKRPISKRTAKRTSGAKTAEIKPSKLKLFDIPLDLLIESPDNPQEMDDATFDELVEGMRADGFDEPIHVINIYDPNGVPTGEYMITSGHHRTKAARVLDLKVVPAVIKKDMDDAARKVALVRRNQVKGAFNKKKFSNLFREVAPILGEAVTKRLMGFTKEAAFAKVYDDMTKSMPKEHRKQLEDAKETVKSVDDLSSILNGIFKKEGSKVKRGYMAFSFGGKKHYYFQIDKQVAAMLEEVKYIIDAQNITANDFFLQALGDKVTVGVSRKPKPKVKVKVKTNAGKNKAA